MNTPPRPSPDRAVKTPGLFSFSGRIRRKTFWKIAIGDVAVLCAIWFFGFLYFILGNDGEMFDPAGNLLPECEPKIALMVLLSGILSLPPLLVLWTAGVRRCHDLGWSGWWLLLQLVPFVGILAFGFFFGALGFWNGNPGENRFGPDPKGFVPENAAISVTACYAGTSPDEIMIPTDWRKVVKRGLFGAVLCLGLAWWQWSDLPTGKPPPIPLFVFVINATIGVLSVFAIVFALLRKGSPNAGGLRLDARGFEWRHAGLGGTQSAEWRMVRRIKDSPNTGSLTIEVCPTDPGKKPKSVLIGTAGLKPEHGEIAAIVNDYFRRFGNPEQVEARYK